MKIYPCNHTVKTVTDKYIDTDLNIPLSYITIDYSKYKIEKVINELFNSNKKTILLPYDKLDRLDTKIFNEYDEEMNNENLIRTKNDLYYYYPKNIIEFEPKSFLWKATIKRNSDYKISNSYNINVSGFSENIMERMASIFSKPSDRSIVPPNISVNHNDVSENTFINVSNKDCDFMFIETPSCIYYDESTEKIDIHDFLTKHTNIWLSCKNADGLNESYQLINTETNYVFEVENPILHSDVTLTSNYYFDIGTLNTVDGIIIHNIFKNKYIAPILILEYAGSGFVILSHYSITENFQKYSEIIYEVLMYIYLRSYKTSDYIKEWISIDLPDYEVKNNVLSTKKSFTSNTNLATYFNSSSNEYDIINITIIDDYNKRITTSLTNDGIGSDVSYIKCIGKNNDRLMFNIDKTILSEYTEPEKPSGWVSVYSNGKIYFLKDLHYLIESDLSDIIYLTEKENDLLVRIYGFKSSSLNINIEHSTNLTIPFIKAQNEVIDRIREAEYIVYIYNNSIDFCFSEDYDNTIENQYELFRIIVGQTEDSINTYDIRQLGGGLPEDEEDNYNLFDIGHINGRPYRPAGTLVITLPKKYEQYKNLIENIVEKYKVAEDYMAIYFEDEEV